MNAIEILFDETGHPLAPAWISESIAKFGDSYINVTKEIIDNSSVLDNDGIVFVNCASRLLANFGMTRSGPFRNNQEEKLRECWKVVGTDLIEINHLVHFSSLARDRYLLEVSAQEREKLIAKIWDITKRLLPFTMGNYSYGLVGASKILFSVLPEIVLPVDNSQWLHVFKTVDLGDVIHGMVLDIKKWEGSTGTQFNVLDRSNRLTTLPSVYNVIAMDARP